MSGLTLKIMLVGSRPCSRRLRVFHFWCILPHTCLTLSLVTGLDKLRSTWNRHRWAESIELRSRIPALSSLQGRRNAAFLLWNWQFMKLAIQSIGLVVKESLLTRKDQLDSMVLRKLCLHNILKYFGYLGYLRSRCTPSASVVPRT